MTNIKKVSVSVTFIAVILAFVVVTLGAYTRLTDAGLGCPDWPGCYDRMVAPTTQTAIEQADSLYPSVPVQVRKAWTEMIHRYAAATLGLLILGLAIAAIRRRKAPGQILVVPIILVGLVVFQALLGKWTVTMKLLPIVVMGHLLGGLTILALLWWWHLKAGDYFHDTPKSAHKFKSWAIIGLIIIGVQIVLGGWTSTNYAALVCLSFPYCSSGQFFPQTDFHQAFNFLNFSNQHLGYAALVTIQMTHRIGALIVTLYVGLLSLCLLFGKQRKILPGIGAALLLFLILQITLGVLNIELYLPLFTAVLHNTGAALLLLSMVTLLYVTAKRNSELT